MATYNHVYAFNKVFEKVVKARLPQLEKDIKSFVSSVTSRSTYFYLRFDVSKIGGLTITLRHSSDLDSHDKQYMDPWKYKEVLNLYFSPEKVFEVLKNPKNIKNGDFYNKILNLLLFVESLTEKGSIDGVEYGLSVFRKEDSIISPWPAIPWWDIDNLRGKNVETYEKLTKEAIERYELQLNGGVKKTLPTEGLVKERLKKVADSVFKEALDYLSIRTINPKGYWDQYHFTVDVLNGGSVIRVSEYYNYTDKFNGMEKTNVAGERDYSASISEFTSNNKNSKVSRVLQEIQTIYSGFNGELVPKIRLTFTYTKDLLVHIYGSETKGDFYVQLFSR